MPLPALDLLVVDELRECVGCPGKAMGAITYGRLSSRLLGHLGVPKFGTFCVTPPRSAAYCAF
jgi:hypothetical protein